MPESNVWPPKPDLPDPLTEYDDVIAAKLAASSPAVSGRLTLVKILREQEGLDLRQAIAVANSYCNRHGLFVSGRATKAFVWGGCGIAFAAVCLGFTNAYLIVFRNEAVMRQPHHHAAFMALVRLEIVIVAATMLLALASTIISGIIRRESRKKG